MLQLIFFNNLLIINLNNNIYKRNPENKNRFILIFQLFSLTILFLIIFGRIETVSILKSSLIHLILWNLMICPSFNFFFRFIYNGSILCLLVIENLCWLTCLVELLILLITLVHFSTVQIKSLQLFISYKKIVSICYLIQHFSFVGHVFA